MWFRGFRSPDHRIIRSPDLLPINVIRGHQWLGGFLSLAICQILSTNYWFIQTKYETILLLPFSAATKISVTLCPLYPPRRAIPRRSTHGSIRHRCGFCRKLTGLKSDHY
jgi:hypothetical protein